MTRFTRAIQGYMRRCLFLWMAWSPGSRYVRPEDGRAMTIGYLRSLTGI